MIFEIGVLLFGAAIGSFLNVVIVRLPHEHLSIVGPRSYCPSCRQSLSWFDLVPLFSWAWLRGKCRYCKAAISWRYPFIELMISILALALYRSYGFSPSFFEFFFFALLLVAVAFIDLDLFLIPLSLCILLISGGLFFAFLNGQLLWRSLGALAGFLILAVVLVVGTYFLRKAGRLKPDETAMGWGDPLLLSGIGAFLGVFSLPWVILFASLTAIVAVLLVELSGRLGFAAPTNISGVPPKAVPFGPFLAVAALACAFFDLPQIRL